MSTPMNLFITIAAACFLGSCTTLEQRKFKPSREIVTRKSQTGGKLHAAEAKTATEDPPPHWMCAVSNFGLTGIYAGKTGYRNQNYLANIALKDSAGRIVADLYFFERTEDMWENPIPKSRAGRPQEKESLFYLAFKASALSPMLEQLRHTPSKLYIEYYDGCWRLATIPTEPVRLP